MGIGLLGVSLAFGLTVLTGAYAFGHISGGHFNPAVSLGLAAGGRFPGKELPPYMLAQVAGAILAAFVLYQIASGNGAFAIDPAAPGAFATNGYDALSRGGYSLAAALVCEIVMTAMFLVVVMGATHPTCTCRFGSDSHWLGTDFDPSDQHSGYQYIGQPSALHWRRPIGRQWRIDATMVCFGWHRSSEAQSAARCIAG